MPTSARLRFAAVLASVQGLAHGALLLLAKPRHGASEQAVIDAMQAHRFDFSGAARSYWDFYIGYGLEAAAVCLVEAALLMQLAAIAKSHSALVRPILALLAIANVGHALLTMRYFFYLPALFDLAIAACIALAFVSAVPAMSPPR